MGDRWTRISWILIQTSPSSNIIKLGNRSRAHDCRTSKPTSLQLYIQIWLMCDLSGPINYIAYCVQFLNRKIPNRYFLVKMCKLLYNCNLMFVPMIACTKFKWNARVNHLLSRFLVFFFSVALSNPAKNDPLQSQFRHDRFDRTRASLTIIIQSIIFKKWTNRLRSWQMFVVTVYVFFLSQITNKMYVKCSCFQMQQIIFSCWFVVVPTRKYACVSLTTIFC